MGLKLSVRVLVESGRGQPHSTTLRDICCRCQFREVVECGCPLPLSWRRLWVASTVIALTGGARSGNPVHRFREWRNQGISFMDLISLRAYRLNLKLNQWQTGRRI